MDSGASVSVTMPCTGEGIPLMPSEGSKAGLSYKTASGAKLLNKGEKHLNVVTEEGQEFQMNVQCADVCTSLTAISQICDAGAGDNLVVFGKAGGYVYHADLNTYTEFGRRGGVYPLRTWIRRGESAEGAADAPFQRQGF